MKSLYWISLFSFLFLLSACGEGTGKRATSLNGNRMKRGRIVGVTSDLQAQSLSTQEKWGRIYLYNGGVQANQQSTFQTSVRDFLSPQLLASELGTVSGDLQSQSTGIAFYGEGISFSQNVQYSTGSGFQSALNVFNKETSALRIVVHDSRVGSTQGQEQLTAIPIHFNQDGKAQTGGLTASKVEGDLIQLIFEDEYGKISLEGAVRGSYFEGLVRYRNLKKMNAGGQSVDQIQDAKDLGYFIVEACKFFNEAQIAGLTCS